MSFEASQKLLARLYTDAALRRRFFDAPEEVGRAHGVDGAASRALASAVPRRQVDGFSRALLAKHRRQVRRLLPRTAAILGEAFDAHFAAYAETERPRRPPSGWRKIPRDALSFAAFLEGRNLEPGARALLRWEATWVRAQDPRFRFAVRVLPYRLGGERPSLGWSVHLWWRVGRLRYVAWPG